MAFVLGAVSRANLVGVHPDLAKVVHAAIAITPVDFRVIEGVRSLAREAEMVRQGASQTLRSRHLTGHAVDVCAILDGKVSWTWAPYPRIAEAMKRAARSVGIPIEWGGDWKTLKDGGHFELPWASYPIER